MATGWTALIIHIRLLESNLILHVVHKLLNVHALSVDGKLSLQHDINILNLSVLLDDSLVAIVDKLFGHYGHSSHLWHREVAELRQVQYLLAQLFLLFDGDLVYDCFEVVFVQDDHGCLWASAYDFFIVEVCWLV